MDYEQALQKFEVHVQRELQYMEWARQLIDNSRRKARIELGYLGVHSLYLDRFEVQFDKTRVEIKNSAFLWHVDGCVVGQQKWTKKVTPSLIENIDQFLDQLIEKEKELCRKTNNDPRENYKKVTDEERGWTYPRAFKTLTQTLQKEFQNLKALGQIAKNSGQKANFKILSFGKTHYLVLGKFTLELKGKSLLEIEHPQFEVEIDRHGNAFAGRVTKKITRAILEDPDPFLTKLLEKKTTSRR